MESRLIINDKTLGWFITFIVINNIIALSFNIDNLFYLFCSICLIFILYKSKTLHFNKGMILLYIACILSLLVNDTQSFFKPWDRLLSFILITTLVSPFIESNYIMRFRIRLFNSLLLIYQMIVIGSIITHFAGIHFYREEHYTGITKHSMLLAPVSAIIIIYCIYTLTSIKHISKFQKLYFSTLLIAAFLTLFLCASRTALISSIIAISIYLIIIYHHKIKSFIKISIVTLILLILSFQIGRAHV